MDPIGAVGNDESAVLGGAAVFARSEFRRDNVLTLELVPWPRVKQQQILRLTVNGGDRDYYCYFQRFFVVVVVVVLVVVVNVF